MSDVPTNTVVPDNVIPFMSGGWFEKMAAVCFAAEERMSEHGATKANMDHLLGEPDDLIHDGA